MKEMMNAVRAQVSPAVMVWLNVMTLVLLVGGAVFMFSHFAALLVFLSALASALIAVWLFRLYRNIYVLGATHIPLWGPLLVYIVAVEFAGGSVDLAQPYGIWLVAASLIMFVSLIFDVRDLYLVLTADRGRFETNEA